MCFYVNKLDVMLCNIFFNLEGDVGIVFGQECFVECVCIVVVIFNCGLCGVFNFNVIKVVCVVMEGKFV